MVLKKMLIAFFWVFCLTLPALITAKEASTPANKNKISINSEAKLLAKRSESYDLNNVAETSGNSPMDINSFLSSPDEFEEIITKVDSGRVTALYPTISVNEDAYQNHFEAGHKVQRILQELLPLNIF